MFFFINITIFNTTSDISLRITINTIVITAVISESVLVHYICYPPCLFIFLYLLSLLSFILLISSLLPSFFSLYSLSCFPFLFFIVSSSSFPYFLSLYSLPCLPFSSFSFNYCTSLFTQPLYSSLTSLHSSPPPPPSTVILLLLILFVLCLFPSFLLLLLSFLLFFFYTIINTITLILSQDNHPCHSHPTSSIKSYASL